MTHICDTKETWVNPLCLSDAKWRLWERVDTASHYDDVIMTMLASQITSLPVVCSIVYSDVNQRKHQSSASLAFVREIHRGPVNFPHKWPVTRKMFPFDDVIMISDFLPDRTKLSPAPIVTYHQLGPVTFNWRQFPKSWFSCETNIDLNITYTDLIDNIHISLRPVS